MDNVGRDLAVVERDEGGAPLLGKRLAELVGGKGKVVMLRYQVGSASTEAREAGFLAAARAAGLEVLVDNRYAGATVGDAKNAALNLADQMVQASCYQLMLTHEVGNYTLPPGWDIIAAGNTEKDRANVTRMAGPLANRMVHLTVEADLEEWIAYARAVGVDPRIIAFQRFKKGLALHVFDARAKEPAFPSPRTWVYLDRLLQAATKKGTPISVVDDLISGTVGPAVSIELRAFFDHMVGLPTAQEIFSSPDRAPVPDKLSAKYAVMSMLDKQVDEKTFPAAYKYIKRLNTPEITVLFGRDASNHDSRIKLLPEFRDFAMEHRDLVLG